MPRLYGYAPRGQGCFGQHNWQAKGRTNVIGALLGKALMAVGLFICSVNSDVFHVWVIQILLPSLPPDSVVVMDNAPFHKRLDTQKVIDDAGHIIEYLPPYSPDLNPVEHKWAEAKSKRRAVNCSIDALFSHYMT